MQREIKNLMNNPEQFNDHPGRLQESEIFELSNIRAIANVEMEDEEGVPTYFTDVVNFWMDPYNGKYMKKYCEIKAMQMFENKDKDTDDFVQLGKT